MGVSNFDFLFPVDDHLCGVYMHWLRADTGLGASLALHCYRAGMLEWQPSHPPWRLCHVPSKEVFLETKRLSNPCLVCVTMMPLHGNSVLGE